MSRAGRGASSRVGFQTRYRKLHAAWPRGARRPGPRIATGASLLSVSPTLKRRVRAHASHRKTYVIPGQLLDAYRGRHAFPAWCDMERKRRELRAVLGARNESRTVSVR